MIKLFVSSLIITLSIMQVACLIVPPAASSWILPKEREIYSPEDRLRRKKMKEERKKEFVVQQKRQKIKEQFQYQPR